MPSRIPSFFSLGLPSLTIFIGIFSPFRGDSSVTVLFQPVYSTGHVACAKAVVDIDDGNPAGANLYTGHAGKVVDLTAVLSTGTPLVVHYTAQGAALDYFNSNPAAGAGTAYFRASMKTNREAPLEADASIRINDPADPTSGDTPDDYTGGDYGGVGGADDSLDTSWQAGGCNLPDGQVVQCAEGADYYSDETCCEKDGVVGCWPRTDCDSYTPAFSCTPDNISDNPDAAGARFATPLMDGCTCEEACAAEFNLFGTTQGYDGGSYRPVADIVQEDQGLAPGGSDDSAYWEAFAAEKASALADCVAQCQESEILCHPDNPETFASQYENLTFKVAGGKAPYTWSVEGSHALSAEDSPSMAAPQTDARENTLNTQAQSCGRILVTVTDAVGQSVTCIIYNPNEGNWLPDSDVNHWYTAASRHDSECGTQFLQRRILVDDSLKQCRFVCWGGGDPYNLYDCPLDLGHVTLTDEIYGTGCSASGCSLQSHVECVALEVKIYACKAEAAYYASLQNTPCASY